MFNLSSNHFTQALFQLTYTVFNSFRYQYQHSRNVNIKSNNIHK